MAHNLDNTERPRACWPGPMGEGVAVVMQVMRMIMIMMVIIIIIIIIMIITIIVMTINTIIAKITIMIKN